MTLSYSETKVLIDLVLSESIENARELLHERLKQIGRLETEFCAGVIEHGRGLPYNSEQWADFISKVPNILFRDEIWMMNKLSENQRRQLKLE